MVSYQAPLLPFVDYKSIENDDDLSFSLTDLEYGIMRDCHDFLDHLKTALMKDKLAQVHELLVAHLCAYLGTVITTHTVKQAESLEPLVIDLIKHQAQAAFEHFNQHPINGTIKNHDEKLKNVKILRETAPGSIVVQTMRIGREMQDMLQALSQNRENQFKKGKPPKQSELFCSHDIFIKMILVISAQQCANWREKLDNLSDHYVINQFAIQIGWLIGYFSHLENKPVDETEYFNYGLPVLTLYREHTYKLMEAYATKVIDLEEEALKNEKIKTDKLLNEIKSLSEEVYKENTPIFTNFQKQTAMVHAHIEKKVIELIMEKYSLKIILMSLFYFWFSLEAPLHVKDHESIDLQDGFSHMVPIIELIKKIILSQPQPNLSENIKALNDKMQSLKEYLQTPQELDQPPENLKEQTEHVNLTIHTAICEHLKSNLPIDSIIIPLFHLWMRLSVFFGVNEKDWQKMDYYFSKIMSDVRQYLSSIK